MKYLVVADDDLKGLVVQVNRAMADGWHPQGGISVAVHLDGSTGYFQAMVRG